MNANELFANPTQDTAPRYNYAPGNLVVLSDNFTKFSVAMVDSNNNGLVMGRISGMLDGKFVAGADSKEIKVRKRRPAQNQQEYDFLLAALAFVKNCEDQFNAQFGNTIKQLFGYQNAQNTGYAPNAPAVVNQACDPSQCAPVAPMAAPAPMAQPAYQAQPIQPAVNGPALYPAQMNVPAPATMPFQAPVQANQGPPMPYQPNYAQQAYAGGVQPMAPGAGFPVGANAGFAAAQAPAEVDNSNPF
jgi:hypothetical protein